jgi:molecular chaperone GrpE (heat shock protein)
MSDLFSVCDEHDWANQKAGLQCPHCRIDELEAENQRLREDAAKINEEELARRLLGYMERLTAAVEAIAINTAPSEKSLADILLTMGETNDDN